MTFFHHTHPRARVEHICDSCGRVISKGERYTRQFGADGHVWTYKECNHCAALVVLWRFWSEVESYSREAFADYDASDVTDLRWKVQWRRKWRRRDGQLYPVPARAAS